MEDLKQAFRAAFELVDAHQSGGNAVMGNVKLKLKEAVAFFSPELSAEFHSKIAVGAAGATGGRSSFAWTGDLPGKNKGGKKLDVSVPPVAEIEEKPQVKQGTVTVEETTALYEKLASLKLNEILESYESVLGNIANGLGIELDPSYNPRQQAAAIKKAAKEKLGIA